MIRAAAYARFSSASQREESIEIQLDAIREFSERQGWELVEEYTDYAVSGRREDRPAFNRCVADALAGKFDVLAVLKIDRFARNVKYAQEVKRLLFAAGIGLWSVREGRVDDTPEGFLMAGINDLWAEHYSRKLSVDVKGGIRKSAEEHKAAGRRIYGYTQDADDRFVPDGRKAEVVRSIFEDYAAGRSMNEIRDRLNASGERNVFGRPWTVGTIGNVLKNPAYHGLYRYDGVEQEGAIPAIIDRELFERVAELRRRRKNSKRRMVVNEYLLTGKVWCARCGKPMCGTAGTGRSGKKYTYYGCVNKDGCGLRVASAPVEDAVADAVVGMLSDPATLDAIAQDMVEYGATLTSHANEYRAERAEQCRRRDNFIRALGDGAPYQSVSGALRDCEDRISELDRMIGEEEAEFDQYRDIEAARDFLRRTMRGAADDDDLVRVLNNMLIDRIYVDKEGIALALNLTAEPGGDPFEYTVEEIRDVLHGRKSAKPVLNMPIPPSGESVKKSEPAGKQRVRTKTQWSG